ncbi:MAG TPA: hypothetical protein VMW72_04045 [Sedimentisphaerales bacterium]|nr:hypothetical protein [Sedimentisphaerales bacterium]
MQDQNEFTRINRFLRMVSPIVISQVKMILQSAGLQVEEKGSGSELIFIIKSGEKEIHFSPYNLLLEIASIDRDEMPLRFDENLEDFGFFLDKTARLTQSKLHILFKLLAEDDVEKAIDNISRDAEQYQRIRIWRFDQENPSPQRPP